MPIHHLIQIYPHHFGLSTTTAAAQQQTSLISERCHSQDDSRLHPRQAFISDLQAFILQIQAANEDVILVGDFNEELNAPNSRMGELATRCGLADVFAIRLGSSDLPATYQRGTKRLDYVLATPLLVPSIIAAGYDPFSYRIPSDHRGMYIDLVTEALFRHQIPPLAPASRRELVSSTHTSPRKCNICRGFGTCCHTSSPITTSRNH